MFPSNTNKYNTCSIKVFGEKNNIAKKNELRKYIDQQRGVRALKGVSRHYF